MRYNDFLKSKLITNQPSGFECNDFPDMMYPYQKDLTRWACKRGKAALFCMTGTGKTMMQAAWADAVCSQTNRVLILAPLAVSKQTVREAAKIGIQITYCRDASEVKSTGYVALKSGRKTLLSELKESYFKQAVLNCISAEKETMPLLNLEP